MHDLVISGGMVVDGSGAEPRRADVAIDGDTIVAVGADVGAARRTIDATDRLVTPGFVDVHTHLDAQLAWDPIGTSTCWHGVTSVVIGNCGMTFAPVRDGEAPFLARAMEAVEDIPADSILAGLPWNWNTHGEYLQWLASEPKGLNFAGFVGHGAVRYYAMGDRSLDAGAEPTDEELAVMVDLVDEAMRAGAVGFSTSRTGRHVTFDGRNVPGTWAGERELVALASVLGRHGRGVLGCAPRFDGEGPGLERARSEVAIMAAMSRASGRPFTFNLTSVHADPQQWRQVLDFVSEANAGGANLRPQTTSRSIGVIFSLAHKTPFDNRTGWEVIAGRTLEERVAILRDPSVRADLIARGDGRRGLEGTREYFVLTPARGARYDSRPEDSLAAHAERAGTTAVEAYLDLVDATDGQVILNWPILNQDFTVIDQMLTDPRMMLGLADSGAHVGQILDASQPTFFLSYWIRERGLMSIGEGVHQLTGRPAELFGFTDRGRLAVGARADINVFSLEELSLPLPTFQRDFPAGAGRFVQRSQGYDATIVNGSVFMERGEHTGAMAGRPLLAS
ncbi:MAG: amidohydrolase family protein [Acidobacteria bacterium]|nr:amidohydrolase family protein [Acidobacteriota bacterium]